MDTIGYLLVGFVMIVIPAVTWAAWLLWKNRPEPTVKQRIMQEAKRQEKEQRKADAKAKREQAEKEQAEKDRLVLEQMKREKAAIQPKRRMASEQELLADIRYIMTWLFWVMVVVCLFSFTTCVHTCSTSYAVNSEWIIRPFNR
jgi:hypothetical protein